MPLGLLESEHYVSVTLYITLYNFATTLFDPEKHPAQALDELYRARW